MNRIFIQIIVLTTCFCLVTGCSSFTSHEKRKAEDKLSNISDTSSKKDVTNTENDDSVGIVPELPELEPIQEATNTQTASNNKDKNSTVNTESENLLANTDKNTPITVVRFPEAEKPQQKSTSEIQQINYEEPVLEPLPDTPVVTGETRPNQWQSVNKETDSKTEQESIIDNASDLTTEKCTTIEKSTQDDTLSMTSDVMSTDNTSAIIKPTNLTEKNTVKKITLPKPMTDGSKPMESGVVLEELPDSVPDTDSTNSTPSDSSSTTNTDTIENLDFPDEVFELPVLPENTVDEATLVNQKTFAKTTPKSENEIQQCSAAEPVKQLQMSSLIFVTAIRKKGDFTAIAKPYLFNPGQTLLLYIEIENPNSISKLSSGFEILDSTGKKILSQSTSSDTPTNESSFFQYVKFALPENILPGDYSVRVWGKAPNDKDLASAKINFQVK